MKRDFTDNAKTELFSLVAETEQEKWSDFTDRIGDKWYAFEEWIGLLNIQNSLDDVNRYHKKVIDKNNATEESIQRIFDAVRGVDDAYFRELSQLSELLGQWITYVTELGACISPKTASFPNDWSPDKMRSALSSIDEQRVNCLRNRMVQDLGGELVFNEDLIYQYMKKGPEELSDREKAMLLTVIAELKDSVALYSTVASYGDDQFGVDVGNRVAWVSEDKRFGSYSAVSAHYNDIYINVLNQIYELSESKETFAASLVTAGVSSSTLKLLGTEYERSLEGVFGTRESFTKYVAKYKTEHTETYFEKLEVSTKTEGKGSMEIGKAKDGLEDKLKDNGLRAEDNDVTYFDKDGNEISEKDAPTFYKSAVTLAEFGVSTGASYSCFETSIATGGEGSKLDITAGKAEVHAGVSGGFSLFKSSKEGDDNHYAGVGISAEVGASVTAFEADWEQQWLGDENLGLNTEVGLTAGKAEATASGTFQLIGADGGIDPQAAINLKAEAIAGEATAAIGVNVLGGEIGVEGGINFGIGAHADVGFKDGVLKCDIGASLGVGVSLDVNIDVGGMVDTVVDAASSVWEGMKEGWNSFLSWW